jgi:hypothetical protein
MVGEFVLKGNGVRRLGDGLSNGIVVLLAGDEVLSGCDVILVAVGRPSGTIPLG